MLIVIVHWNNSTRVDMSLRSDTVYWFRTNQSLLFLLNAVCLARSYKYFHNVWVFFNYRIKSCSYSYPNMFSRTWWLLDISTIYKKYRIKIECKVWVWSLGHLTYCHLLWCLLSYICLIIVFLPNLYQEKGFRSVKSFTVSCL